ncbi:MAG: rRNA methyltransferase [Provencibacterium sp.]|nr:rRNA methyltransferase [Provencibacterium sp.]
MQLPEMLRPPLEALAQQYGAAACADAARQLSLRYRSENGSGKRLATTAIETAAYALTRMPATFCAVYSALRWTLECVPCHPESLLDVGAGTGAAAFAAEELLSLQQITLLEREPEMRRTGQFLMRETPLCSAGWQEGDVLEPFPVKAGLVTASYLLNELREEALSAALQRLWEAAEEMLLILEPGTPAGYAVIRRAHEELLKQGAFIAAPCPHMGACPLSQEDWCHFTCRVERSRLHKQLKGGDVPYEDEKFCYLALVKSPPQPAPARILRHPYIEPGRVSLRLCTPEGLAEPVIRKRDGALFKSARKADCGDGFPFP